MTYVLIFTAVPRVLKNTQLCQLNPKRFDHILTMIGFIPFAFNSNHEKRSLFPFRRMKFSFNSIIL